MKTNFTATLLFLAIMALPLWSQAQISGQYPLMTTNKNNGYQIGVGKLPVENGETLGRFRMRGWVTDGYYHPGVEIKSIITGPVNGDGFPADLYFSTGYPNLTHRMAITAGGRVGIGTNNPDFELHTVGNTHTTGDFYGRIHIDDNGSADSPPSSYIDEVYFELHQRGAFATQPVTTTDFGGLLTLGPGGSSHDHQLFFAEDGIFHRHMAGGGASWANPWVKLLSSADISGTENQIAKFTGTSSLGDSQLFDDGNQVGIRTSSPTATFDVDIVGDTRNGGNFTVTGNAFVQTSMAINTTNIPSGYRLAVDGNIICEELRVLLSPAWPDYVFEESYPLMPLEEVEAKIAEDGHLPGIPSAAEVEAQGLEMGAITSQQQEKIEELYLHLIDMNKQMQELRQENTQLRERLERLENGKQ